MIVYPVKFFKSFDKNYKLYLLTIMNSIGKIRIMERSGTLNGKYFF